jgi:NAD(P)-dependent dehydrogenase (short-subunit alcohol dehydrogenase family)
VARTILITGSTDGLGRRVGQMLAERGDRVLIHGRDAEKVERVVAEVGAERGYVADLSSLENVRRLADEVKRDEDRIDVLVNNAGIVAPERSESEDGHELTFAVNYLAHFLLTRELLPIVGRVVNVASAGQKRIDFDDVMLEQDYDGYTAYAQSKLAQIMFTVELAERGTASDTLHPATFMDTNMVLQFGGQPASSVEEGAEALVRLIDDTDGSGRYFDGTEESSAHRQAYDADARRQLWELSEELSRASA